MFAGEIKRIVRVIGRSPDCLQRMVVSELRGVLVVVVVMIMLHLVLVFLAMLCYVVGLMPFLTHRDK